MEDLIFVSVASYRDPDTQKTLDCLIESAYNPKRLRIVVIEQNDKTDKFACEPRDNVRVMRNVEAKGPAWARYLASSLWSNERWYLQIDSHMIFVKNWDKYIVEEMLNIQRLRKEDPEKCVITCYPPPQTNKDIFVSSVTEKWFFDSNSHIIAQGSISAIKTEPVLGFFVSAGFLFFESEYFLEEIPYDPKLQYLFQGEEILLSARLFTRNWGVYHPRFCVCFHDYIRKDKPKIWTDNPEFWVNNKAAVRRYRYLTHQLKCGVPPPNIYGEGGKRTIKEWKEKIKLSSERLFD